MSGIDLDRSVTQFNSGAKEKDGFSKTKELAIRKLRAAGRMLKLLSLDNECTGICIRGERGKAA